MKKKTVLKNADVFLIALFMVLSTTIVTGNTASIKGKGIGVLSERGNTLLADTLNNRVIEVDSSGTIVWQKADLNFPADAERLENGNTLIAEAGNHRVIEVDNGGTIVWQKTGLNYPFDAERISGPPDAPIIDGSSEGIVGEEYMFTFNATDPDGDDVKYFIDWGDYNTEWTGYHPSGTDVKVKHTWSEKGNYTIKAKAKDINGAESDWTDFEVTIVENQRPIAPAIGGQTSGKPGKEYEYTFNAVDPDGDDVKYFINWGDTVSEWTGFNTSGTDVKVKHIWSEKGTYNITAKAQDIHGAEGPEGTLTVTMPRYKQATNSLLLWMFERFPMLERLLILTRGI